MRRRLRAISIQTVSVSLVFAVSLVATTGVFASDFETVTKAAIRSNQTEEGAAYMEKCAAVLQKYLAAAMDVCGAKFPDTTEPAVIALVISANGRVTQKMSSPGQAYGECVASHLPAGLSLPRPPHDAWPVVVGVENHHHKVAAAKAGGGSSKAVLSDYDEAIAPYVAKGRATYPAAKKRFLGGLPGDSRFLVRIRLRQGNKIEECFVQVTGYTGKEVSGVVDGVAILTNYHKGQRVSFSEDDIKDWLIQYSNGTQDGNVVGKFLRLSKH